MNDVQVLLVTYNSAEFIGAAVESCLRQGLRVLVVDNASLDTTLAAIPEDPRVRVIANRENRGFAGAVNQGVEATDASLLLLLNPDTVLLTPIDPLVNAVVANGHSVAAGVLLDEEGKPQNGFTFRRLPAPAALAFEVLGINRIWPGNPVNRRYRCLDLDPQQAQEVEQPAGAFLLFRRSDWQRLGGFDEGFHPVWFEDVDFCGRLLDAGGSIWFDPSVRARHHGGHSVQKIELGCRQRTWYGSLLRYAAKHYPPSSRRIVAGVVAMAVLPRLLFGLQVNSIKSIWRMAWKCFQTGGSWEGPAV
jgi:GT2 family glycosyltransferase